MDESSETNISPCGRTPTTACKDLNEGVEKTAWSGTVLIIGNYHIQRTIILSRSILITTDNIQKAKITSIGTIDFAFELICGREFTVELKGLRLENIGVLDVQCEFNKPSIELDGITVTNITGDKRTIQIVGWGDKGMFVEVRYEMQHQYIHHVLHLD